LTPVEEDNARIITQAELLANASDVEGDSLTASNLTITSGNGDLVDNGDGTWTYTPAANDDSDVVFAYNITDGPNTVVGTATLDILPVNDSPANSEVTLTPVEEDNARIITQAELLVNASDVEGDSLAVNNLTITSGNGDLVDNGDGTWTYTPVANDDSDVVFDYNITDGTNAVVGTATLDILPVNDAPVFANFVPEVSVGPEQLSVIGLVATDQEGDNISFQLSDTADQQFFEIDQANEILRFRQIPDFGFLGEAGSATLFVEVIAEDAIGAQSDERIVAISIPEFAVPTPQNLNLTPAFDSSDDSSDDSDGESAVSDIAPLPTVGILASPSDGGVVLQPARPVSERNAGGVDDFNYSSEEFVIASSVSDIDLDFFESNYQQAEFVQAAELVSQQLVDSFVTRRKTEDVDENNDGLAALFWQQLASSNEDYLRQNLDAANVNITATASAGLLSAGLLFAIYGGSITITTLATQLPAWKSLDVSPLISSFDEEEESIHEIVDG
jgi:hypothetical protein